MSNTQANHPYASYVDTREWHVIDRALSDLVENHDLVETTGHEYLVGYLCKSLLDSGSVSARTPAEAPVLTPKEDRRNLLAWAQETARAANTDNRDLVQELIEERRAEAARD